MSRLTIFECEQNTPEWLQARLGIPTASAFDNIVSPDGSPITGRGGKGDSKTRRTYMMKLIGELITGEPKYEYENDHMRRGHVVEPEARDWYMFQTDTVAQKVGFVRNDLIGCGCSPDSLISSDGSLEIKSKLPHLQAEIILSGEVPREHNPQLQGQLWIMERDWVDFVSYCPKMPPFLKRVYRDDAFINSLAGAVMAFQLELGQLYRRVQEGVRFPYAALA